VEIGNTKERIKSKAALWKHHLNPEDLSLECEELCTQGKDRTATVGNMEPFRGCARQLLGTISNLRFCFRNYPDEFELDVLQTKRGTQRAMITYEYLDP
jgi:hypothetical protein